MDFEEIVLSKAELSALKSLKQAYLEKFELKVETQNRDIFDRLVHFGLADVHPCTVAESGATLRFPLPKVARITDRGLDYLAYIDGQKKNTRSGRRHEVALTLIGAAAGALITLLVEHFGQLLDLIRALWN